MPYPCTRAMVSDVTTVKPDQTIEEVLNIFKEKSIRNVPVVGDDGTFLGMLGLQQVLMALLPKAATMQHGLDNLNFAVGSAPGIAKKLLKVHKLLVSDIMKTEVHLVHCETPTIEALRVMANHGSPVVVTEKETNRFRGFISRKTLLDDLYKLLEEIEAEDKTDAA